MILVMLNKFARAFGLLGPSMLELFEYLFSIASNNEVLLAFRIGNYDFFGNHVFYKDRVRMWPPFLGEIIFVLMSCR